MMVVSCHGTQKYRHTYGHVLGAEIQHIHPPHHTVSGDAERRAEKLKRNLMIDWKILPMRLLVSAPCPVLSNAYHSAL